jgi:integrase/recombinase XerC
MSPYVQSFLSYLEYERRYSAGIPLSHTVNDLEQLYFSISNLNLRRRNQNWPHTSENQVMDSQDDGDESMSPRSINRKLSTLKSFFKFLMRKGVSQEKPIGQGAWPPRQRRRLPVFVEKSNIERLLRDIKSSLQDLKERVTRS